MACPKEMLSTKHCKDMNPHTGPRKFNTQVGDLFHSGMAIRDPKSNWREPEHTGVPHVSHATFMEKKLTHKVQHHQTRELDPYVPVETLSRTFEVGRPAFGYSVGGKASPTSTTSPISPRSMRPKSAPDQSKFKSHQELTLLKRRHMTHMGNGNNDVGPGAHGGGERRMGSMGGQTRNDHPVAGIVSKGKVDLVRLEPSNPQTPHKSQIEFNLKKQQHLCQLHKTQKDDRF